MSRKKTIEEVREFVESQGYTLISDVYVNNKTPLEIMCDKGHKFDMRFDHFKSGQRCSVCSGKKKKTYEEVREFIENQGYKLLSTEYINSSSKLKIQCPQCHEFEMNYSHFKNGTRCPYCGGSKKKTIEEVREFIETQGYRLISDVYVNSKSKLDIMCPEGHIFPMSYSCFKGQGQRCPICMNKINGEKRKTPYEEVKKTIESVEGYKLLSTEYINNSSKLDIECPEGHVFPMSYNNFRRGHRCPVCSGNKKLTYEEVKKTIESVEGYKLLSTEYINNSSKLKVQCPDGHVFPMSYNGFRGGSRCPICNNLYGYKNNKYTYKEVKEFIEGEGYKLISDVYVNNNTNLKIQCPEGHIFEPKFSNFKNGSRCPECMKKVVGLKQRLSYEEVKTYIESIEGYKLLSKEYIDSKNKLDIMCPQGHEFKMRYNDFNQGVRCPFCNLSKGEEEIKMLLENYKVKYETQYKFDNCRNILPLPFDFYIPDMNICIEYDGKQHFEPTAFGSKMSKEELLEQFEIVQLRDQIKTDYCKDNNIKLIRIPYTEFDNIEEILVRELNLKNLYKNY